MAIMTIGERIKFLRNQKNISQKELADKIDVSATALAFAENDQRTPSKEIIKKLAKFFNLPGDAFLSDSFDISGLSITKDILIPYYNVEASAGAGLYAESEYVSQYLMISDGKFADYLHGVKNPTAITIRGNSMAPNLNDGDLVIIDPDDTDVVDNAVYVINVNGELLIKRLFRDVFEKKLVVKSDNPQYPENRVEPDSVKICGRMRWKMFGVI